MLPLESGSSFDSEGVNERRLKKRILVVDDQPGFAVLLQRAMKEFEVREVLEAGSAMAMASEWRPDLLLIDFMMPDMHGMDLAVRFAGSESLRDIPIVFLSALIHNHEANAEPVLIDGYPAFGKPFKVEALRSYIAQQLADGRGEERPLSQGRIAGE